MLKLCLGFLVDTLIYIKWLARLSIFIHADILLLVSEFVVVVVGDNHCEHIPGSVKNFPSKAKTHSHIW